MTFEEWWECNMPNDFEYELNRLVKLSTKLAWYAATKAAIPKGYVVVPVRDVIEILSYREGTTIYEGAEGRLRRAFDEAAQENKDAS